MADSSDSIPARKAMTKAEGNSSTTRAMLISGSAGMGKVLGNAPKREKIVSTGKAAIATSTDVIPTATINPGKRGAIRRSTTIRTIVASPIPKATTLVVSRAAQRVSSLATNSAGTCAVFSPNRSFNWLVAMMIPMPMVNPLITGSGT